MECPACRFLNPAGHRFCGQCGGALGAACPACGFDIAVGMAFCGHCGQSLAPVPSAAEIAGPLGERRQATVLFSDLSGFTALSERLDPEEVEALMRRLKQRAVGIVEQHGGIVSQFVGDEVLALFGVPVAHEDDPLRAVRAAQGLHGLARELSPEVEGRVGHPLRMHSGIHTGLVVTSTADSRDGTVGVTGDTVNTAARLKALAEDDAILLGPGTARLVEPYVPVEALPAAALKGKAATVEPYRVAGEVGERSRFEAAGARRGFTEFAGRERELAALRAALERTVAGQGQIVTVVGEAGVGKSRLVYEFRRGIDREAVTVLEGRCQSYGAETPYLPLLDGLRRGLRLNDIADPAALHAAAMERIRAVSPELERFLPHLLHLLSIPTDTHRLPKKLQGQELRRELEEALAATITLNTAHRPMVLIYEDWHWADEASDSALNNVIGLVGHHPLLLVVLHRPEYQRQWPELEHHTALRLHSLDVDQTGRMLGAVLGVEALPEGLAETVHARTGGNALFNEEMARALMEDGAVEVSAGSARLSRPLSDLRLPDTIHAVIRARVDRLDAADREVLRLASVIGREFDRAVLERLCADAPAAGSRQEVAATLARLARQDLVHQARVVPQAEYLFKHVLTQEVVYETLLLSQRKQLHGAAAAAIEALYADRIEEHLEALASHYSRSAETGKAIAYLEAAGKKAGAYFSLEQARNYFRQALELTGTPGNSADERRNFIRLSMKWAEVCRYVPSDANVANLETALECAQSLDDGALTARLTYWIGNLEFYRGNVQESVRRMTQCIDMGDALGDDAIFSAAYNAVGRACLSMAEHRQGVDYLEKGIALMERLGNAEEVSWSSGFLAVMLSCLGQFDRALAEADKCLRIAREIGNKPREGLGYWYAAVIHLQRGNWAEAMGACDAAAAIGQEITNLNLTWLATGTKGTAAFMAGNPAQGIEWALTPCLKLETTSLRITLTSNTARLAELYLLAGQPDAASEWVARCLGYVATGDLLGDTVAQRVTGLAAAVRNSPDWAAAETSFEESLSLSGKRGEDAENAVTHLRYAELRHKQGNLDAAHAQLDRAEAQFREMGMSWWLTQAEGLRTPLTGGEPFVWFAPYVEGPPKLDA